MLFVLAFAAFVAAWVALERSNELFVLSWRDGEMRLVRGVVPGRLRFELGDALKRMKVKSTRLRVAKSEGGARLTASGLDDFTTQRLRNIVRLFPLSQLRSGTAPAQNKLLRVFGFTALLWLFGSRDGE